MRCARHDLRLHFQVLVLPALQCPNELGERKIIVLELGDRQEQFCRQIIVRLREFPLKIERIGLSIAQRRADDDIALEKLWTVKEHIQAKKTTE